MDNGTLGGFLHQSVNIESNSHTFCSFTNYTKMRYANLYN